LKEFLELWDELGHPPSQREVQRASREGKCSGSVRFLNSFGTWDDLLSAAQADSQADERRLTFTYGIPFGQLLEGFRAVANQLKRVPTTSDIIQGSKDGLCASWPTFLRNFPGGIEEVIVAAGMGTLRDALLREFLDVQTQFDYPLTFSDWQMASVTRGCNEARRFIRYFGSWDELLKAAGLG
jgi:hypothetical protein